MGSFPGTLQTFGPPLLYRAVRATQATTQLGAALAHPGQGAPHAPPARGATKQGAPPPAHAAPQSREGEELRQLWSAVELLARAPSPKVASVDLLDLRVQVRGPMRKSCLQGIPFHKLQVPTSFTSVFGVMHVHKHWVELESRGFSGGDSQLEVGKLGGHGSTHLQRSTYANYPTILMLVASTNLCFNSQTMEI